MERTVLEESWRQNGPDGPSHEVSDDNDDGLLKGAVSSSVYIPLSDRMINE
jgi:hypothetical protein